MRTDLKINFASLYSFEEMNSRFLSVMDGLIPPEDECLHLFGCCRTHTKVETPSLIELELAAKPHRWAEMRKLHKDFFNAAIDKVTEYEIDLLSLFNLPNIETIRATTKEDETGSTTEFQYTPAMDKGFTRIVKEWQKDLLGTDKLIKQLNQENFAIYDYYELSAYSVGLKRMAELIRDNWPDELNESLIERILLAPDIENRYLQAVIKDGGKRIKTRLGKTYLQDVRTVLRDMAKTGKNPIVVGRYLHRAIGEGQAWYWNRITRSESALAINAAFTAQSVAGEVQYEQWSAAGNACVICAAMDGHTWKLGSGPEPVSSTHPNCVKWNTKVFTDRGYKFIRDINIGELVLTHNGRFMPVVKIHKTKHRNEFMVRINYRNSTYNPGKPGNLVNLDLTGNHPLLLNGKWTNAGEAKQSDKITLLATRCEVCKELIPYSRWRNKVGEKSHFCSQKCNTQKTVEKYGSKYLTEKAHEITREMAIAGTHPFQRTEVISAANRSNSIIKYNTRAEKSLSESLNSHGIAHERQFMIKRPEMRKCGRNGMMNRFYKTDIALPDLKIVIECNEEWWHRDKIYHSERKKFIEQNGFTVLEFNNNEIFNNVNSCIERIERVAMNHSKMYEFIDIEIESVEQIPIIDIDLYNLSVLEDNSYIAKGFVVHNCLCIRIPLYHTERRIESAWDRETPYDKPYTRVEIENLFRRAA